MDRRQLLRFGASAAALPLLAACGDQTPVVVTPTIQTDLQKAQSVVSAVSGVMNPLLQELGGMVGVNPTSLANWTSLANQVVSAATGVMGAVSATAGQGVATTFANALKALLSALPTSGLPSGVQRIISDVQAVMPIVMTVFQIAMLFAAPFHPGAVAVDPNQALLDLQRIAAGR